MKFNIAVKNNIISPPAPVNPFMSLTAKQKKRKRNKLNKLMKKYQTDSLVNENSISLPSESTQVPLSVPTPNFNSFQSIPIPPNNKIPPPPGCEEAAESAEQENKSLNVSVNDNANDSLAKINKVKSTMDMSEWPPSLTYVSIRIQII